jgi:transcriptional regulator with PAS, ATPase and Fis domain
MISEKIIGQSPKFLEALNTAKRVASSSANIFIMAESGTGKEHFAKLIHTNSKHQNGPFVAINCTAIPENLFESEFFGHSKGSFTGAFDKRAGLFEEAQNGTLFMDEIGDLSLSVQAKLLRVLEEKKIKRVGENTFRPVNCRIISATNRNLLIEVQAKRFREDLFYRLNVIPIVIPPLRERVEDIELLTEYFLKYYALINGLPQKTISNEALEYLTISKWPGNVRELENAIERSVILSTKNEIGLQDLISILSNDPLVPVGNGSMESIEENTFTVRCASGLPTLDEITRLYIEFAVMNKGGARDKTAKEIGIDRKTLYKKLRTPIQCY